jgi:hypothetical protein
MVGDEFRAAPGRQSVYCSGRCRTAAHRDRRWEELNGQKWQERQAAAQRQAAIYDAQTENAKALCLAILNDPGMTKAEMQAKAQAALDWLSGRRPS